MTHLRIIFSSRQLGNYKGWKSLKVLETWAKQQNLSIPSLRRIERLKWLYYQHRQAVPAARASLWIFCEVRGLRRNLSTYRDMLRHYGFKDPRKKKATAQQTHWTVGLYGGILVGDLAQPPSLDGPGTLPPGAPQVTIDTNTGNYVLVTPNA